MTIIKLPSIVYPLSLVDKTNEIIDVLNDNLNMYYSEENPALTSSGGVCTWTVTHNLGTENINYSVYEGSASIIADVSIVSENAIVVTLNSSSNITAGTFSIVIISNGAGSSQGSIVEIDSELSTTSTNPVQNRIITNYVQPSLSNFIPKGTIISVKTDGSGNFTKLSDAINYLSNKWSNGAVVIQLGTGTFNETEEITINGRESLEYNIPWIIVKGNGASNTIVQWNYTTSLNTIYCNHCSMTFENLTFKNATYSSSISYWGFQARSLSNIIIDTCNFENLSNTISASEGSKVTLRGTINITNSRTVAVRGMYTGEINSFNGVTINMSSCATGLQVSQGSIIRLSAPTLSFNSVTTKCNVTPNTITSDGIVMGFTV